MSDYITGHEILKHWEIKSFELFDTIKNGLRIYRKKTGRIFKCPSKYNLKTKLENIKKWLAKLEHPDFPNNLSEDDRDRLTFFNTPEFVLDDLRKAEHEIIGKLKRVEMGNDNKNKCSWVYCDLPDSEIEAGKLIDSVLDSNFLKEDVLQKLGPSKKGYASTQKGKKLRPCQRHKIECRRIAAELWNKDHSITIADMAVRDEISLVSAPSLAVLWLKYGYYSEIRRPVDGPLSSVPCNGHFRLILILPGKYGHLYWPAARRHLRFRWHFLRSRCKLRLRL